MYYFRYNYFADRLTIVIITLNIRVLYAFKNFSNKILFFGIIIYVKEKFSIIYLDTYPVCINTLLEYYERLCVLSGGNVYEFLDYLLEKYKKAILRKKVSSTKKTATTTYQPKTKNYVKRTILIRPYIWRKYKELKEMTGYSISALIRIFTEWEMKKYYGHKPTWIDWFDDIFSDDISDDINEQNYISANKYIRIIKGDQNENKIVCSFNDCFT